MFAEDSDVKSKGVVEWDIDGGWQRRLEWMKSSWLVILSGLVDRS